MPITENQQDIYIVGYALRLPDSNNPQEFHENLKQKINMVTKDDQHLQHGLKDAQAYLGKIKQSIDEFDNLFFSIHGKQAEKLDPQLRLLLETSFEAMVDAAIFPDEIKGSNTGVYTGVSFSDAHHLWTQNIETMTGYEHSGCAATMYSNRLSYFYDLHGPSMIIDTACSSSLTALHYAMNDLKLGNCDTAFVSGISIVLRSAITAGFHLLQMLSPDGFCKTFDTGANGYSRADGIVTLMLTKRPDLIRYAPHAKILGTSVNTCGYHETGISYPSHQWQAELYKQLLNKTNTAPSEIHYIECHGTGTTVGDNEELKGIKQVFGDREDLALGALKSNMGHAESASGLASIAKVLLSYETHTLYPQLHLQNPISELGHLRTISEPEYWQKPDKVLINGFGFGGSNACVLLDHISAETLHTHKTIAETWHGLYFISSRTKEGLYSLKRELERSPQQLPVFTDHYHSWREVVGCADDPQLEPVKTRPLYFVFSGNGSQWQGMGVQLMQASKLFKKTLSTCGKDIPKLLLNGWDDVIQETRVLTAVQIALIELLTSFGIKADGYLAHSAGEIAASYASGATTLSETMAIAKARGQAAKEMPDGLMISVGLSHEDALSYIADFDQVWVACINSPRNVTLTGNRQQIEAIMHRLEGEEKFVRLINTQGKPYHSPLIDSHSVNMHLESAYQGKAKRNSAWISAIEGYDPPDFSVDYHIQSVTRPVDFLGAMQKLPSHAILLEVGPHSILRGLIHDCVSTVQYVSLMQKHANDLEAFKAGIGQLWKLGVNLPITPDRVRPPLSVRVKQTAWKRESFPVPRDNAKKYKHTFIFDLQGKDAYLLGHTIEGSAIFPAMGMAYLFWQCYLEYHPGCSIVTLDNLKILRSIPLVGEKIQLDVLITPGEKYQLLLHDELVAEAILGEKNQPSQAASIPTFQSKDTINQKTFYRFCHTHGYDYVNDFQVLRSIYVPDSQSHLYADIQFNHWIDFLDGMLQLVLLRVSLKDMLLPTSIRHIELSYNKSTEVSYNRYTKTIQCGEILIQDGEFTPVLRRAAKPATVVYQKEDYLLLGQNQVDVDRAAYRKHLLAFTIAQFKLVQDKLSAPHYQSIKEVLEQYDLTLDLKQLSQYPNTFFYQLVQDAYHQYDEFIKSPLSWISSRDYYANIYYDDFANNIEYIAKIISVVRQNTASLKINLFEIGTGTGGFLKQASQCLYSQDTINCSDLTENRSTQHAFAPHLNINFYHFDINQVISAEIQALIAQADVVVASNVLHCSDNLQANLAQFYQLMKPGAFMFLIEITSPLMLPLFGMDAATWNFSDKREYGLWTTVEHWKRLFSTTHFQLISYETDPQEIMTTFLIRKSPNQNYTVMDAPSALFDDSWVNRIKETNEPIILYANEPGGMAGFARTLNMEGKRTLSYCAPEPSQFLEEIKSYELVTNIVRDNKLATLCYTPIQPSHDRVIPANEAYHLEFFEPGNMEQFKFVKSKPRIGQLCQVDFAALNFRDVMLASGKINQSSFLGMSKDGSGVGIEFSGHLGKKRIIGIALDAIANFVNTDLFWEIPEDIELSAAATIPVAYLTVYYAFFERVHIKKKHKILIHGGAGAVGQAAIRVALSVGCEVFTTCQESKREYLQALFPELDDSHIYNSRSTQFEQLIKNNTDGAGVDIILNSLADDKLQASLHCLAQHGVFIEIGKYDLMRNTPIGLKHFLPNTTFCGIDLDQIFTNKVVMKRLAARLSKGLACGIVKPIDHTLFNWKQISEAARFLGSGNHKGKIVIDMRNLELQHSENRFYTSGAHLIVGGLGGIGMSVAEWLAERGAENLILVSRNGVTTGEQKLFIQRLKSQYPHLKIDIATVDLIQPDNARAFFKTCPPLTGVYNLAMVLNDTYFDTMTAQKWQGTINCKILITYQLDQLTRNHPIKHFVCFSSVAVHGNVGQSNYAFANHFMESICYDRRELGLPGMAIQWGPIADVGFVAQQDSAMQELILASLGGCLSIKSCLEYFESCLLHDNVVSLVFQNEASAQEITASSDDILKKISSILKINLDTIDDDSTLVVLGLDSLQSAEIQSVISYATKDIIPISELGKMTVGEIKAKFSQKTAEKIEVNRTTPVENTEKVDDLNQIRNIMLQHGEEVVLT